jgi:plasmid replication initiation protein
MNKNSSLVVLKSKTPKIYKDNKLNTANFGNFTHGEYQVFLHLVSKIGGVDQEGKYLQPDQLERSHVLTAREFSAVFNTDIHNSYKLLNKACKKLMKTDLTIARNESAELWQINICSMAKYNKKEGSVVIKFTDDIMPYLAQVRKKFVLYNLKEISNFNSIYTTRLYELVQQFKDTGYIIKSVNQLRELFATDAKFKAYKDFKKRTFEHACKEINNNHELNLGYEELKEGRKVVAIKFVFTKTRIHKVTNPKTGIEKNYYIKPKQKKKISKPSNPDVLEVQLAFTEIKKEPKPIQSILSKVLSKFKY